jgi:hypothetical protein
MPQASAVPLTTKVVVVLPTSIPGVEVDPAVVLAIAATFETYGPRNITVLPVAFAKTRLTGQTATNADFWRYRDRMHQLLEAACMYSLITGSQYQPAAAASDATAFGVTESDLTNVLAAAHAAVEDAKPYVPFVVSGPNRAFDVVVQMLYCVELCCISSCTQPYLDLLPRLCKNNASKETRWL